MLHHKGLVYMLTVFTMSVNLMCFGQVFGAANQGLFD